MRQNPVLWIWNLLSYDNFLVYAMTFFGVMHLQVSHFHVKNVIKSFSVDSLLTDSMLYEQGEGVLLDYIRPRFFCAILVRKWV